MKRRLLNLMTLLSLLLCITVAALWVASCWCSPRLYVGHDRGTSGVGLDIRSTPGALEWVGILFESEPGRVAEGINGSMTAERWREGMTRRSAWVRAGFGAHRWHETVAGNGPKYTNHYWGLSLPWWLLTLLFGTGPALHWNRRRFRRRRGAMGLCPSCGYDLRATPGRCPECGALAPAATGR
jgi:hypothetical protein